MAFYDHQKFGLVQRVWFGGMVKEGGSYTPFTYAGSATTKTFMTRYYPQGPIDVLKFGYQSIATASAAANASGSSDRCVIPIKLYKSSAAGVARTTVVATDHIKIHPVATTYCPLWGIGSKQSMASAEVEAGRFLTIYAATAESNEGTAAADPGTILAGGSFRFFIDFIRRYDVSGKHDI